VVLTSKKIEPYQAARLDCLPECPVLHGATVMVTGIWFVSDPEVPINSMVVVPVGA
jgi:hypothetical protein